MLNISQRFRLEKATFERWLARLGFVARWTFFVFQPFSLVMYVRKAEWPHVLMDTRFADLTLGTLFACLLKAALLLIVIALMLCWAFRPGVKHYDLWGKLALWYGGFMVLAGSLIWVVTQMHAQ